MITLRKQYEQEHIIRELAQEIANSGVYIAVTEQRDIFEINCNGFGANVHKNSSGYIHQVVNILFVIKGAVDHFKGLVR